MTALSNLAEKISGQPMFKMLEKVQAMERSGRKVLHFELGEPDFNTPPNIVDAAVSALRRGETHYTSSAGLFDFREAARRTTAFSRHFMPDIDQVMVTPGANAIIYYTMKCVLNPGDEVIVPNPGFPTYYAAADAVGAKVVNLRLRPERRFAMDPADVEAAITPRTKLIIMNTPSNPTGAAMTEEDIRGVAEVASRHDVFLLSDEIYSRLIFSDERHFFSPSELDRCKDHTIVINGFSKAFAMTGWRLGVAIGPARLIEKMILLNETIVSCVPPFTQRGGVEAIVGDHTIADAMAREYKNRCFRMVDGLNELPGVSCYRPDGSIYVFPDIRGTGMSSNEFSDFALEKAGVALLPGNNFGEFGEGFVRLSCVNSMQVIEQALQNLKRALEES